MGALGSSFSKAASAFSNLPCCSNCTADWYCWNAGPVGAEECPPVLPEGEGSFLRSCTTDRASCIMSLSQTPSATRRFPAASAGQIHALTACARYMRQKANAAQAIFIRITPLYVNGASARRDLSTLFLHEFTIHGRVERG